MLIPVTHHHTEEMFTPLRPPIPILVNKKIKINITDLGQTHFIIIFAGI